MNLTVEAVYENGVLKPTQQLPLKEHEKVRVTIQTDTCQTETSLLNLGYGLMGWTGDAETLERIALDPEFLGISAPPT
jgi:predicted DNA-binding antitoxin AbrB/MazE fold protein